MTEHNHAKNSTVVSVMPPCRDCGKVHMNGGDAMRCDHELGRHDRKPFVWVNSQNEVVGCPVCLEGSEVKK